MIRGTEERSRRSVRKDQRDFSVDSVDSDCGVDMACSSVGQLALGVAGSSVALS